MIDWRTCPDPDVQRLLTLQTQLCDEKDLPRNLDLKLLAEHDRISRKLSKQSLRPERIILETFFPALLSPTDQATREAIEAANRETQRLIDEEAAILPIWITGGIPKPRKKTPVLTRIHARQTDDTLD